MSQVGARAPSMGGNNVRQMPAVRVISTGSALESRQLQLGKSDEGRLA